MSFRCRACGYVSEGAVTAGGMDEYHTVAWCSDKKACYERQGKVFKTLGMEEECEDCKILTAKLAATEAQLKKAHEVIGYYAERSNWVSRSGKIGICPIDTEDRDAAAMVGDKAPFPWAGGIKARAYLREYDGRPSSS